MWREQSLWRLLNGKAVTLRICFVDKAEPLVALELGAPEAGGVSKHTVSTYFVQVIKSPELGAQVALAPLSHGVRIVT